MDGRGRAYDNIFVKRLWRSVKYEAIYLNGYSTTGELRLGLTKYFDFYNSERPHQALENQTPQSVYKSAEAREEFVLTLGSTSNRGNLKKPGCVCAKRAFEALPLTPTQAATLRMVGFKSSRPG